MSDPASWESQGSFDRAAMLEAVSAPGAYPRPQRSLIYSDSSDSSGDEEGIETEPAGVYGARRRADHAKLRYAVREITYAEAEARCGDAFACLVGVHARGRLDDGAFGRSADFVLDAWEAVMTLRSRRQLASMARRWASFVARRASVLEHTAEYMAERFLLRRMFGAWARPPVAPAEPVAPLCDVCGHHHHQGERCEVCGHIGKYDQARDGLCAHARGCVGSLGWPWGDTCDEAWAMRQRWHSTETSRPQKAARRLQRAFAAALLHEAIRRRLCNWLQIIRRQAAQRLQRAFRRRHRNGGVEHVTPPHAEPQRRCSGTTRAAPPSRAHRRLFGTPPSTPPPPPTFAYPPLDAWPPYMPLPPQPAPPQPPPPLHPPPAPLSPAQSWRDCAAVSDEQVLRYLSRSAVTAAPRVPDPRISRRLPDPLSGPVGPILPASQSAPERTPGQQKLAAKNLARRARRDLARGGGAS